MTDLDTFRTETRAWLEANCPAEMRKPIRSEDDYCWGGRNWAFQSDAQRQWLEAAAERGWTVPDWPKDYGGGGLSPEEARVLKEEMARIGARPPLVSFGIAMLGPALLKFGTEEQKRHYLPQIARGEIRWCQGYSEPGAGSDLAGLQTKAEDKGDHWLVNGQKVWTSYADKSDWIFCLVRTSSESKQGGISFLLFDMETPGVSTRPILLISGYSPFCETFFDDVKVPKEPGGRRGEQGLGRRQISARPRARDDQRHGPRRRRIARRGDQAGRPDASRGDRQVRRRFARLRGDERAVRGDVEGGRSASGEPVDDEICRDRAQQAPQRAGDGRGRIATRSSGTASAARRQGAARLAALQGQFDRGRHQRDPAQHHRQAYSAAAGAPER